MALTVTATSSTGTSIYLLVQVLPGAREPGGAAVEDTSAGHDSLTPAFSASLPLWAVFHRSATATFTASSHNTILDQGTDAANTAAYGFGYYSSPTVAGTAVTAGCSSSPGSGNNFACYELPPAGVTVPVISAASPAVAVSTASDTVTTASFTPAPGSVLAAMVSVNVTSGTPAMTVTDSSGLTWTLRESAVVSGQGGTWIYTATVAAGGSGVFTRSGWRRWIRKRVIRHPHLPPAIVRAPPVQGTAALAGAGTVSLRLTPLGKITLAGSGAVSVIRAVQRAVIRLAGAGAVTAVARLKAAVAAAGAGHLAVPGRQQGTAGPLAAAGQMTAGARQRAVAHLTSAGTVTPGTIVPSQHGIVTAAGHGTLTTTARQKAAVAPVTAAGHVTAAPRQRSGASLASAGSLSPGSLTPTQRGHVTPAGAGAVAIGVRQRAIAALPGQGSVTATGITHAPATPVAGAGQVTIGGTQAARVTAAGAGRVSAGARQRSAPQVTGAGVVQTAGLVRLTAGIAAAGRVSGAVTKSPVIALAGAGTVGITSMLCGPMPAYNDPSDPAWTALLASPGALPPVIILSPDNGDAAFGASWQALAARLHAAGCTLLGYVYTSSAARSLAAVEASVANYASGGAGTEYGVDGIYIDQFAASPAARDLLIPPAGTAWFGAYPSAPNGAPSTYEASGEVLNGTRKLAIVVAYEKWDTVWPSATQKAQVGGTTGRTALAIRWPPVLNSAPSTTVASGSNGVDVSTFAGSGVLHVASSSGFHAGGSITVPVSGSGTAVVSYTGTGSGTLTGCTTVASAIGGSATATSGTMSTGDTVACQNAQWTDITAGLWDDVITAAGTRWAAYGQPMIVSFSGEFDSTVNQINAVGGGDPRNFVPAWQHIYNLVAPVATNIIWDWNPTGNNTSVSGVFGGTMSIEVMYPGDAYVDWIGFDKYDLTLSYGTPLATYTPWVSFIAGGGLAQNTGTGGHNYPAGTGTTKPLGLFETGVYTAPGFADQPDASVATWVDRVPADIGTLNSTYYPGGGGVQLWCWFNSQGNVIPPSTYPMTCTAMQDIGANAVFNPVPAAPPGSNYDYYASLIASIQAQWTTTSAYGATYTSTYPPAPRQIPLIWAGPAAAVDSSYLTLPVDTYVTAQASESGYLATVPVYNVVTSGVYSTGEGTWPRSLFAHVVYDVPASDVHAIIDRAYANYAGYAYATPQNTYTVLPGAGYLASEVSYAVTAPHATPATPATPVAGAGQVTIGGTQAAAVTMTAAGHCPDRFILEVTAGITGAATVAITGASSSAAGMRGQGAVSTTPARQRAGAAMAGAGQVASLGAARGHGTTALAAAGTVTVPVRQRAGTAMAGAGAMNAPKGRTLAGAALSSAGNTITSHGRQDAVAAIAGAGSLNAVPKAFQRIGAALAGKGRVIFPPVVAGASLAGNGALTTAGHQRAGTAMAGAGKLMAAGATPRATAFLTGAGKFTVAPVAAALSAAGVATVSGSVRLTALASLAGAGTVSARLATRAVVSLHGAGILGPPDVRQPAAAALAAGGKVTAISGIRAVAAAHAAGALAVAAAKAAAASMTGTSALSAPGVTVPAVRVIAGAGAVTVTAAQQAAAVLSGAGTLTALQAGAVTAAGAGAVSVSGVWGAAASMTGTGTLAGLAVLPGSAQMTGAGSVTSTLSTVDLTGAGTLTAALSAAGVAHLAGAGVLGPVLSQVVLAGAGTVTATLTLTKIPGFVTITTRYASLADVTSAPAASAAVTTVPAGAAALTVAYADSASLATAPAGLVTIGNAAS